MAYVLLLSTIIICDMWQTCESGRGGEEKKTVHTCIVLLLYTSTYYNNIIISSHKHYNMRFAAIVCTKRAVRVVCICILNVLYLLR